MAVNEHIQFLLSALGAPGGRNTWLEYKLSHPGMNLAEGDFSSKDLKDFDFSDVDFTGAIFQGCDLTGVDFSDAQLSKADFRRATMCNVCMDRADLSMANMQGAILTDACIEEAVMVETKLQGADLIGADLALSDLTHADLRGASLKYARLSGANFSGANVAEADLTGTVMDDDSPSKMRNFDLAIIDDRKYRMMKSKIREVPRSAKAAAPLNPDDTADLAAENGAASEKGAKPSPASDKESTDSGLFDSKPPSGYKPMKDFKSSFGRQPKPEETDPFKSRPSEPAGEASESETAKSKAPTQATEEPVAPPKQEESPNSARGEDTTKKGAKGYQSFSFGKKDESKPGFSRDGSSPKIEKSATGNRLGVAYVAKARDLETDDGCYRVLGVRSTAPYSEVTKAYRNLAKVFHPDKVRHYDKEDQDFAREQFHLMKKAYEVLSRRKDGANDNIKWVEGVVRRHSPYEQTLDELIKLVDANPGNESLLYNLAYKYSEAGRLEQAIRAYERVLIINPHNEDAAHNLKSVKLQKAFGFSKSR